MLFSILLSFHLIFVITWFAALFYLPRLFVYHADTDDAISNERFKVMERRLYRGILLPSSLAALFFGVWLVLLNWSAYATVGWFWLKAIVVLALFAYQGIISKHLKKFAADCNQHSAKYFRYFNEVPSVVLIIVIFLVILKPF